MGLSLILLAIMIMFCPMMIMTMIGLPTCKRGRICGGFPTSTHGGVLWGLLTCTCGGILGGLLTGTVWWVSAGPMGGLLTGTVGGTPTSAARAIVAGTVGGIPTCAMGGILTGTSGGTPTGLIWAVMIRLGCGTTILKYKFVYLCQYFVRISNSFFSYMQRFIWWDFVGLWFPKFIEKIYDCFLPGKTDTLDVTCDTEDPVGNLGPFVHHNLHILHNIL